MTITDISDPGIFKTRETPLAAYLITIGYPLLDIVYNGDHASFLFENDDPKMQQLIRDFQLMRADAPAAQIISNYQNLVKRIRRRV